jgi:hypothetical protein
VIMVVGGNFLCFDIFNFERLGFAPMDLLFLLYLESDYLMQWTSDCERCVFLYFLGWGGDFSTEVYLT